MIITEPIYRAVESASHRYAYSAEPEDIAQDAYLAMLQAECEPVSPQALATKCVRMAAGQAYRRERAGKRDARRTQHFGLVEVACRNEVPLSEVLEGLSESQQQLLVDRYVEGYTVAEMAVRHGVCHGHMCRLLREALSEARRRCE